jgi:hypothetical protein
VVFGIGVVGLRPRNEELEREQNSRALSLICWRNGCRGGVPSAIMRRIAAHAVRGFNRRNCVRKTRELAEDVRAERGF